MSLPEAKNGAYNDFFFSQPLDSISKPALGKIVTVSASDSVKVATRELGSHSILSAPVRDPEQPSDATWLDKYIGTVDAVNLMYWMLEQVEGESPEHLDDLLRQKFADTPIAEVIECDQDTARFAPFIPLATDNNTMLDVMLLLGKYAQHRAFVVEPGSDISNIITQSALIKFIQNNYGPLEVLVNARIDLLPLGKGDNMVTVQKHQTLFDAFKLMKKHHVSAVPMVDDNNVVSGVVSARDARLMILRPTRLRFLNQPLEIFDDLHVAPFDTKTICCTKHNTLREVIDKLAESQVHRVFLTDDQGHLQGVISLRDVIALFVKEPSDSMIADYFAEHGPAS